MQKMARFVFNNGAPLEIHHMDEEQEKKIIEAAKKGELFEIQKDENHVWADFSQLTYFYIIPETSQPEVQEKICDGE